MNFQVGVVIKIFRIIVTVDQTEQMASQSEVQPVLTNQYQVQDVFLCDWVLFNYHRRPRRLLFENIVDTYFDILGV